MHFCSTLRGRFFLLTTILLLTAAVLYARGGQEKNLPVKATSYDVETWIDANHLLMFVTNTGSFAHQAVNTFGKSDGLYFPFTSVDDIESGLNDNTVIFAAGPWLGAVDRATSDTLTVIAEFTDEYYPGPMVGGTYDPDAESNPNVRVFKLYADSLSGNPGGDYEDYLNYAVPQGAPVDDFGEPAMLGDQMLWTVYNDANPDNKTNNASGTAPLGIEIQLTAWASAEPGSDSLYYDIWYDVTHIGSASLSVVAWAVEPDAITGDTYRVVFEDIASEAAVRGDGASTTSDYPFAWHLENVTTGERLLEWQPVPGVGGPVEGITASVDAGLQSLSSFEVVANAGGELDPPVPGALASAGFPTPNNEDPGSDQQVGSGLWAFHTADNGGTCGGGEWGDYMDFIRRATRDGRNDEFIGNYDYEMRFTGSNSNPGVGGGYAIEIYNDNNVFWVPFELWRIGADTPDNPDDDVRLVPIIVDGLGGNDKYSLESWGCIQDVTGSGYGEHSASDGDDDPFTDWVYWWLPLDETPGDAGYQANEDRMLAGSFDFSLLQVEIFARTVLINWNAGIEPPFGQDCPEQGTVFRINTRPLASAPPDTFTFQSAIPGITTSGAGGLEIYMRYLIFNKGGKTLDNCFFSIWADPDLGGLYDDLVGCDTLSDLFFCYNGAALDEEYGYRAPAVGFKYLFGPMVPSPGDSAYFDGRWVDDYRNLPMTAFMKYINGTDPQNYVWTYQYMNGLDASQGGVPLPNGTKFAFSGDPVTGVGWIDAAPDDRRMMGTCGPFNMAPDDSQYVLVRLAVAQGGDRLESITRLREILNRPFDIVTDAPGSEQPTLPIQYSLKQNYPNPFNPTTTIKFTLPRRSDVKIDIFNILGQRVVTILDETRPAGQHSVVWDGTDENNRPVSTGLYFYRIEAGDYVSSKKMLLLK
ncbi:MAG: T9SS type A sorting domain-containing protein [Candidatus Zixiibacteriota bacterium]|nr:MAG: T9SS type A sorting domain-containing protein [candidate division Zixibacteria bacterium]